MTATNPAAVASPVHPFRTHRVRVSRIDLKPLSASAVHVDLGQLDAEVEDLSVYGMALRLRQGGGLAGRVLPGDCLAGLAVTCEGETSTLGGAAVRHVTVREDDLVLGVEFDSSGIDLGRFYARGMLRTFADRWTQVRAPSDLERVPAPLKAWIMDLRDYLDRLRTFLTKEEEALQAEDDTTRREALRQYLEQAAPAFLEHMGRASTELTDITRDLSEEENRAGRALCRRHLAPLIAHAPFMHRALQKPLGYAGDYELMNMLYRDHAEGASLFGRLLNLYGTRETAGRAVLSRVEYMSEHLRVAASGAPGRVRVASIGCGPARELQLFLERTPELARRIDVALIDQEERSIRYCERTLGPLVARTGARIHFIREPMRQLIVAGSLSSTVGERSLIYSAGLFDYLNDAAFAALLAALYQALLPGGVLVVGNMAPNNPSRAAMEYLVDWFLLYRTADELRALAAHLRPAPASVEVEAEPHGVNLFLVVRR